MKVMTLLLLGFSMMTSFAYSNSFSPVSYCKDCGINNPFDGEIFHKGCPCKHCPASGTETEAEQNQAK